MARPLTMHCQCCGRDIQANTGVIAHHGYQRPAGWQQQIGSCMGSRFLPYEAARERLGDLLGYIKADLDRATARAAGIEAETIPLHFEYSTRERGDRIPRYVEVTRADFEDVREAYRDEMMRYSVHSFDALKRNKTRAARRDACSSCNRSRRMSKAEAIADVLRIAALIVLEAPPCPAARRPFTPTARVRRELIEELETKLTGAGYDFAVIRARMKVIVQENERRSA